LVQKSPPRGATKTAFKRIVEKTQEGKMSVYGWVQWLSSITIQEGNRN